MKRTLPFEFVYQIGSLLIAIIVVHLVYITLIRPNAEAILAAEAQRSAAGEEFVQQRSLYIVLRDYEQESCLILGLWSFAIMGFKIRTAIRERALFDTPIINVSEGTSILPEDTREYIRPIQALPVEVREHLLPRALLAALLRFASTRNVHDVSETVKSVCEAESERLDSELSMVRYIAWAVPAIGFVGTVRGIGEALSQAYRAVQGDIAGVTASLGTAFNSTFVALVISIVMMFVLHQLQLIQDRLVQDTQTFCDQRLLRHLQVRG